MSEVKQGEPIHLEISKRKESLDKVKKFRQQIADMEVGELEILYTALQDEIFVLNREMRNLQQEEQFVRYKMHIVHNVIGCCGDGTQFEEEDE